MGNKLLFAGIFLLFGILSGGYLFGYFNSFSGEFDFPPSIQQSEFVKLCGELNDLDLTTQNIKKLVGWQYTQGELTEPEEGNIERLKNGTDPFFNINHKRRLQNTWVCNISVADGNKIKASAHYQYE